MCVNRLTERRFWLILKTHSHHGRRIDDGYHNVSVTDIGGALGLSAAALYYHFRNKQDLLLDAILDGVDQIDGLIRAADGLEDALYSLTTLTIGSRNVFAVWDRESRHLEGAQREVLRVRGREVAGALVPHLRAARPDLPDADAELLAWAILGVFGSRSRHRLSLSPRQDQQLVFRLAYLTAMCELTPLEVARTGVVEQERQARREFDARLRQPRRSKLLNEAIRLFDERGYQSVTMADIGRAAGIVASGVYRHFPSKTDILVAAMNRGTELMQTRTDHPLAQATTPDEALDLLLRTHIAVVIDGSHLIALLAQERDQLPDKERAALRRRQADYLDTWVDVLREVDQGSSTTELKMVIHAVHAMVYLVARAGRDAVWPDVHERLHDIGRTLLLSRPQAAAQRIARQANAKTY